MIDHKKKYVTRILKVTKKRAATKGYEFDINRDWLTKRISKGICEVSGINFDLEFVLTKNTNKRSPWGPSIDRKNSNKGYTKDNCQIVCNIYNLMKGNSTHKHVLDLCIALLKNNNNA